MNYQGYGGEQQQPVKNRRYQKAITGAVTHGGLIQLTVTGHGLTTNQLVIVAGVGGTTEANGLWRVTVINANTIDLQGSVFTNAYTSGGTATREGT